VSIHELKTKSGIRYQVKLRRPDKTQFSRTFKTKRDAVNFQSVQRADRSRGSWIDDRRSNVTFEEYSLRWLESNPTKRFRTIQRDRAILRKHINPFIGSSAIASIKHFTVQELINRWVQSDLSAATVVRQKAVLSAVFRMALRDEAIVRSPVDGTKTPRVDPSTGRVLNSQEIQQLLQEIDKRFAVPVYVLVTTGLRWSELVGLEIRHFRPLIFPPVLEIYQSAHETENGFEITPPKSLASRRVIPLTREQTEAISVYLSSTSRTGASADAPLFVSPDGQRLRYSNFNPRIWIPATRRSGLDGLKIHDLRKTAITNLVKAGIDLKTVTVLVGHEDIRTTLKHYAKTSPQSLLDATRALVSETFFLPSEIVVESSAIS
jgi:integrase